MSAIKIITNNENETMAVGEKLAPMFKKGSIITLTGDLGAGKTHFVKGFARGLGSSELVTSPTFTILNIYENATLPIYHFDMYRLSSIEEAESLGFEEYFDTKNLDGISLVEWPEQVEGLIKSEHTEIEIKKLDDEKREIIIRRKS